MATGIDPTLQQALNDFNATISAKPNLSEQEIFQKFPEFKNDKNILQSAYDYNATVSSGKYKDINEINSKFPEFDEVNYNKNTPSNTPLVTPSNTPQQPETFMGIPKTELQGYYNQQVAPKTPTEQTLLGKPVKEIEKEVVVNAEKKINDITQQYGSEKSAQYIKDEAKKYQQTNTEASTLLYEKAIELNPNDPENFLQLSWNKLKSGDPQAALQNANAAEMVLRQKPLTERQRLDRVVSQDNPYIHQIKAVALQQLGDYQNSAEEGKKSINVLSQKPTGEYLYQQNENDLNDLAYTSNIVAQSYANMGDQENADKYNKQTKDFENYSKSIVMAKNNEAWNKWFAEGGLNRIFEAPFKPELEAAYGVVDGVVNIGKDIKDFDKKEITASSLKILNDALSTTFSGVMLANPVVNYEFAALSAVGENYFPKTYEKIMQPVSQFISDTNKLSKTQKELVTTGNTICNLVMFHYFGKVTKSLTGGKSIFARKEAQEGAELINKIATEQKLTDAEIKTVESIIEESPDNVVVASAKLAEKVAEKKKEIEPVSEPTNEPISEPVKPITEEKPEIDAIANELKAVLEKERLKVDDELIDEAVSIIAEVPEAKDNIITAIEEAKNNTELKAELDKIEAEVETPTETISEPLKDVESTAKALDEIDNKKTGNDNIGGVAEKTIPNDFKDKIDEFKKTQKIVRFKIGDTEIFIYNDKLNKFPTSSINNPKHIYINLDHLSDASKIFGFGSDYVDAYYAFLHELEHSDKKHDAVSTKDWDKYINSTQEVEAANRADNWIRDFQSNKTLSEAYHKAKQDGTNPELVKAVEDLLGKKESPPANDIPATTKVEPIEPIAEVTPKVKPVKPTRSGIKKAKAEKQIKPQENGKTQKSQADVETIGGTTQTKTKRVRQGTRKIFQKVRHEGILKALSIESERPDDLALQYFLTPRGRILPSEIKRLFRGSKTEANKRFLLWSKDGKTLDGIAHELWESLSEENRDSYSTSDMKNALEDVIKNHHSPTAMAETLNKRYGLKEEIPEPEEFDYYYGKGYDPYEVDNMSHFIDTMTPEELAKMEKNVNSPEFLEKEIERHFEIESQKTDEQKITEQVKRDIKNEITEKEQQIKNIEKVKSEKLNKYNKRNTLFGDKEAIKKEAELFDVESKVGKMSAEELVKEENLQIEKLKKDIVDIKDSEQKRIKKTIKSEQAQTELELPTTEQQAIEKIKRGIDGVMEKMGGKKAILQENRDTLIKNLRDIVEGYGELTIEKLRQVVVNLLSAYKEKFNISDKEVQDIADEVLKKESGKKEISLKHEATEQMREELGLEPREKRKGKSDIELEQEADVKIKKGLNVTDLADDINSGKESLSDLNYVILSKYAAELENKLANTDIKSPEFDKLLNDIDNIYKASESGGSELGAGLGIRGRKKVIVEESLSDYFVTERNLNRDAPLTEKQKQTVMDEFNKEKSAREALEKKVKQLQEDLNKKEALRILRQERANTPQIKRTYEYYAKERTEIKDSIREKLKKARQQTQAVIIPYANELIAIAPDVAKLAKSYIAEGKTRLEDIIKDIYKDLKSEIPDLKESDINDILAGEYNTAKYTKNEAAKQLFELRQEAKAISKLEKLMAGEEPVVEKLKRQKNQKVAELQKQIKEHDLTKLSQYKSRVKTQTEKIQADLDSGNLLKTEKKQITLDKEARELTNNLIKVRQERDVRIMKEKYSQRDSYEKTRDMIVEVLNVPRAIMSSMDFSAPLRQGLIASVSHPKIAAKAFPSMFGQAFSQMKFDKWFYDVKGHPLYPVAKESRLYISDPLDMRLTAKEEMFMNNLAEKIPIIGKLVKGSERAYIGYLNKMRWDIFSQMVERFEAEGKTYENSPKLYKATAHYINNLTGRGTLGKAETAAPILSTLIFAPRLIASRINMLTNFMNPTFYRKVPKEVRVQYFKDMGTFIGVGMTALALAKLAGADVETDPRSADFGKIKIGDSRWDIWGGHGQYIRLFTQLLLGQSKSSTTGVIKDLSGEGAFGSTRGDVLMRFIRGKSAPIPSLAFDWATGRTIIGDKFTWTKAAESRLLPLLYSDVKEAAKTGNMGKVLGIGLPAMFGVGVQTYNNKDYVKKIMDKRKEPKKELTPEEKKQNKIEKAIGEENLKKQAEYYGIEYVPTGKKKTDKKRTNTKKSDLDLDLNLD